MTNAELIQAIRAEIEMRIKLYSVTNEKEQWIVNTYLSVLSFLSTLESEKPINQEELIEEVKRYYSENFDYISSDQPTLSILTNIARHFAQWGAEHLANSNDEVVINGHKVEYDKDKGAITIEEIPNDLEEATEEYKQQVTEETKCHHNALTYAEGYEDALLLIPDAFIAGAKWQKEQIEKMWLEDRDGCFWDGVEEGKKAMKEQMLKGAVKWLVDDDYHEATEKGRFILGSVGIGYNGYYIPYSDLLKLPKEDDQ